ncbi:hypothetical protein IscW_ISCW003327 [Ixodes scapularis]|uniref:Uncharacterized protein n=1 Tax=Ixodes scapularis TaxID=6945 RepID=B7PCU9_IXOSC|nr:hypothetical protein IscW_ISCW003327 [Ixodes scapularis]|eukprot:XP_002410309.1 hypothetical protein IscW_ISCW003327 [Ixodes scapularis]
MLGALRRPLFKRSNSDTTHVPKESQQSPNEQWATWLTVEFDDQRRMSRRMVSLSPEEEHLQRRLAAWDPFEEESYALFSPDMPDLPQEESSDALVPFGPPHETKREFSSSMASICECDSCPSRTFCSNESRLYGMTTDPNLYDDMHWIMESAGARLASSSEQQFPSSAARPPDVSGGTSGKDRHQPVMSHPAPCASQVRTKVAAADGIAETLPYTVQSRHHNLNLTSLQSVLGGWKSSSEGFDIKSCEDSFTQSAKGTLPVRGAQRLSGATKSPVVPVEVHPRETRVRRRPPAPSLQGPRPEKDVQGASTVTTPRDVTVYPSETPEVGVSLRRGEPKNTKARHKRSTKKTKEPKNRKPPQNRYYRGLEADSKDNKPTHDGDAVSAIASASPADSIHRINRLVDTRRLANDSDSAWSELTFSEPDCVTLSSAGEVKILINLTSKRKRTMVWPFRLCAP